MSIIVRVYGSGRNPPEWNRVLSGSEVAVFAEDAHTETPVADEMGKAMCEIFDALEVAETHCRELANQKPSSAI